MTLLPEIAEELYEAAARRAKRSVRRGGPSARIRIPRLLSAPVRTGFRTVPVALSIVAALAVVFVALAVKHGPGSAVGQGAPATTAGHVHPAFQYATNMAYIKRRMLAAAADERSDISASTTTYVPRLGAANGYTNRSWFDPVTRAQRTEHVVGGAIQSELGETVTTTPGMVHWHYIEVDFRNRTWYSYTHNDPGSLKPRRSLLLGPGFGLLSQRRCPYAVAGPAIVDGQETIALGPANRIQGRHCAGPTVWVNASTYQVVREGDGSGTQNSAIGTHGTTTTDQQWIPRTPTGVAVVHVQIPAGFTESKSPPPFDPSAY